ncbi:RNA polymerase sigma factor [Niabella aurantiaca]|uniref:RNA polymerase sigma factor n=1 Tax=Niabella aurantiaca TaxID=379900 RepID=UPI0003750357|nr:sigma-70 family RNA polymerase sigma factor [Niabella aurantiaca]
MADEVILLRRLSENDEQAFVALYKKYQPKLSRFLYPFANADDAPEIVQDIFLKIWEKRASLICIRSFEQYLYRMAKNRLLDLQKSNKARQQRETGTPYNNRVQEDGFQQTEYKEVYTNALKAISELSERQQRIYQLRIFEDKTLDEISEQLAISKAVTIKQLYLATRFVRQKLSRYQGLDHFVTGTLIILTSFF